MKEREPVIHPFERVPAELKEYTQWVNWRIEQDHKIPMNPTTLGNAGVHWPNTWVSFDKATETAAHKQLGLGFVLTDEDPYTCVDIDHCVGENGQVSDQIRSILTLLAGYVELSPSGTGLHIWIKSQVPINRRTIGTEVYSSGRWMTISGRCHPQAPPVIPERTAELAELVTLYFHHEEREFTNAPVVLEDEDLWQRLFHSKNGAFFESLYRGDTSVCNDDHSRAVIMLANQLAILTDLDEARVKRLLYQTGLINKKWEARRRNSTWIDYQIEDALRYVTGRKR